MRSVCYFELLNSVAKSILNPSLTQESAPLPQLQNKRTKGHWDFCAEKKLS